MEDIKSLYKNKRVLVTGHTGFKGSWLSIWLKQLGAEVIGISLDPVSERDLFILADLSGKITDYRQDIRDLEKIEQIIYKEQPEIVFHLAAQPLVLPSYNDPVLTFETNVMGTVNLLEACRKTKSVRQIVVVTTDKVYENKEQLTGYKENDPLGGHDPYSASKAAAEIVTQSYSKSFFQSPNQSTNHPITPSVSTARAGNVIGGGDWAESRLMPDCVRSLEAGEQILIRNPESVRPWQHVLDPLAGYLLLAQKMAEDPHKYQGAWNFGPDDEAVVTVKELVETLIACWGNGRWDEVNGVSKSHEAGILMLDISKAKKLLGWKPVLSLKETVEWTTYWYKNYPREDVYKLCSEQIEKYMEKWNSGNKK